ncbi:hypothetical protein WDZ92_30245 [Nostoc sp. NIES-2111]
MKTAAVFLLAILAAAFTTACVTTKETPEERKERRRNAPLDSNCRFEAYCQTYDLRPASAPSK